MPSKRNNAPTPADDALASLADSRPQWDALMERITALAPKAEFLWKTYAGKTGRQCVIRSSDRNVGYLKPQESRFLLSVALSDPAVADLAKAEVPRELINEVEASPRYPEGRPARVVVDSPRSLETAMTILTIKLADMKRPKKPRGA